MLRPTTLLLLLCLNLGLSHVAAMQCSFGHKNFLSEVMDSCPGILDSSDKSYCCLDISDERAYCCNFNEFVGKSTWIIVAIIVTVVFVVLIVSSCISCLCCSCCPWYRRRHLGTVYGKVQVPSVVHVIQTPANVPHPTQPYPSVITNATSSTGMSQPPPYAEAVYEKQAPYNPTYPVQH